MFSEKAEKGYVCKGKQELSEALVGIFRDEAQQRDHVSRFITLFRKWEIKIFANKLISKHAHFTAHFISRKLSAEGARFSAVN